MELFALRENKWYCIALGIVLGKQNLGYERDQIKIQTGEEKKIQA